MGKFFDLDSPLMRALSRMGDLLILNLIMVICCIPVVTAGAAFTALHYVLLKIVRDREGYLLRGFFKSFAANFKQATLIWLMMLLVIGVYIGDILIFRFSAVDFPKVLVIAVTVVAILAAMMAIYVFPLLARFDNTVKNTLKNAMILAFANLPKTILMMLCYALPLLVCYFAPRMAILAFLFGISAPAYGAAWIYSGIFKKLEPEAEEPLEDMEFTLQTEEENESADSSGQ